MKVNEYISAKCWPGRVGNQCPPPDLDLLLMSPTGLSLSQARQLGAMGPWEQTCEWRGSLVEKARCAGFREVTCPCLRQELILPVGGPPHPWFSLGPHRVPADAPAPFWVYISANSSLSYLNGNLYNSRQSPTATALYKLTWSQKTNIPSLFNNCSDFNGFEE